MCLISFPGQPLCFPILFPLFPFSFLLLCPVLGLRAVALWPRAVALVCLWVSHMRARCHGDHCVQGQGFINTAAAVSSPPLITSSVLSIPPSWPLLVPFVHLFPSSSSSHPPPLVLPLLVMVCSFLPILYSFFARS